MIRDWLLKIFLKDKRGGNSRRGPVISNLEVTSQSTYSATVVFDTDVLTEYRIRYGPYGHLDYGITPWSSIYASLATHHVSPIYGLEADKAYVVEVEVRNATGETTKSEVVTVFTTSVDL